MHGIGDTVVVTPIGFLGGELNNFVRGLFFRSIGFSSEAAARLQSGFSSAPTKDFISGFKEMFSVFFFLVFFAAICN
jgi:hypothetical protein